MCGKSKSENKNKKKEQAHTLPHTHPHIQPHTGIPSECARLQDTRHSAAELFILAISFLSIKCCRKSQRRTPIHTRRLKAEASKRDSCSRCLLAGQLAVCVCVCVCLYVARDANHMLLLVTFYENVLLCLDSTRLETTRRCSLHILPVLLILCVLLAARCSVHTAATLARSSHTHSHTDKL